MTTRPTRTTTMRPNSLRTTTPGNRRDLRNHTPLLPPSTYRTTPLNPTTTRLTVPPLTPSRIRDHPSGMARPGLPSISPSHRPHLCPSLPFLLPRSADRNPRPYLPPPPLRLRLRHLRLHPWPPPSVYMQLRPSRIPTRRLDEQQGHPRPPTRLPNPSANRGRKKLLLLGILHPWHQQVRWILTLERQASPPFFFSFVSPPFPRVETDGMMYLFARARVTYCS